ncbi:hypothetical protein B296_00056840, partial [Ensete ventricosum]
FKAPALLQQALRVAVLGGSRVLRWLTFHTARRDRRSTRKRSKNKPKQAVFASDKKEVEACWRNRGDPSARKKTNPFPRRIASRPPQSLSGGDELVLQARLSGEALLHIGRLFIVRRINRRPEHRSHIAAVGRERER